MAHLLGKRKRRLQLEDGSEEESAKELDLQQDGYSTLFRQYFEANFEPLPILQPSGSSNVTDAVRNANNDDETDWEGLSDEGDGPAKVIEYSAPQHRESGLSRDDFKSFMTSKPPRAEDSTAPAPSSKVKTSIDKDDNESDAANLKKDLALQRLLKESHLLEDRSSLEVSGKGRHKALDLRLQDLGSKSSVYAQQKMPIAQRKGIIAKATERENARRREALENGIVLEKAGQGRKKTDVKKREREVGGPSVGKFRGGTLSLSKRDVAQIQGPKKRERGKR